MSRRGPAKPARILILAMLLGAAFRSAASAAAPADIDRPVPLPANESETVLLRWLADEGFQVARERTADGGARLFARRGGESWEIVVVPASPLASRVRAAFARQGAADPAAASAVRDRLDRYVNANGRGGEPAGLLAVPPAVRSRSGAAVCLSASRPGGEQIRFSGVVVDGSGSVVSTAHDLEGVDAATASLEGGEEATAWLRRRDATRDLSLFRIRGGAAGKVSVAGARDVLAVGEPVFSIGCPGTVRPVVRGGVVSGPPLKADGMPLWPVDMETLPGSSGGPVFDGAGRFVGVVKGRFRGTGSQGFVIPARTIADFLGGAESPAAIPRARERR